jgi:hypothetical protein
VVSDDHGDAYSVYVGIEEIFAVSFGLHPEAVNQCGIRGLAYVFRDEAEVCANTGSAGGELWFSGKLVRDVGVGGHLVGVIEGCLREDWIEVEQRKVAGGAILIGGGEEILLGYIGGYGCEAGEGHDSQEKDDSKGLANSGVMPH